MIPFDLELVARLCQIQCTDKEIAAVLDVDQDTIVLRKERDPEFARILQKQREQGKMSLRRAQWKKAIEGSIPMLIWLGKQYLGQREKTDILTDGLPVEFSIQLDGPRGQRTLAGSQDGPADLPADRIQKTGSNGDKIA